MGNTDIGVVSHGGIGNYYLGFTYSLVSTGSLILKGCTWAASGGSYTLYPSGKLPRFSHEFSYLIVRRVTLISYIDITVIEWQVVIWHRSPTEKIDCI